MLSIKEISDMVPPGSIFLPPQDTHDLFIVGDMRKNEGWFAFILDDKLRDSLTKILLSFVDEQDE